MNRIIKLIIAAGCIFSLIAFPVACGGDDAAEHKAPVKKAEAKPEVKHEVKPEVKPEASPEAAPEAKHEAKKKAKPGPDKAIEMLKAGNARFVDGIPNHPHINRARLIQAGKENQGDHAYATVITCSDSRVPVELLFDAGIMDIFVIRVAGNVCDTDEIGSIEYGLCHVNTPVLVVLGHTQCGAVTAVTHAVHGTGHALERNIPPLVDNIEPAVQLGMSKHSDVHGDDIIPYAIEENVWQGIKDLFMDSAASREIVKSGKAKVVGAIYDVGTGIVTWLPEHKTIDILKKVEANPDRAMNAMAGGGHAKEGSGH
jgi:carbonic anhydrase